TSFINNGEITIDNSYRYGIYQKDSLINNGEIILGREADSSITALFMDKNSSVLENYGSVEIHKTNSGNGISLIANATINNYDSIAIFGNGPNMNGISNFAIFQNLNGGVCLIRNTGNGIVNYNILENGPNSHMLIDTSNNGFVNTVGTFTNKGNLMIDRFTSQGIFLDNNFYNDTDGVIGISMNDAINIGKVGIFSVAEWTNAGTININPATNNTLIILTDTFTNSTTGTVNIYTNGVSNSVKLNPGTGITNQNIFNIFE
ncbi:MAG: hypothetical protein AAGK97_14840, partial [Bacteroidota bacterium]